MGSDLRTAAKAGNNWISRFSKSDKIDLRKTLPLPERSPVESNPIIQACQDHILLLRIQLGQCERKKEEQEAENEQSQTFGSVGDFLATLVTSFYYFCNYSQFRDTVNPCLTSCKNYVAACFEEPILLKSEGPVPSSQGTQSVGEEIFECFNELQETADALGACEESLVEEDSEE